MVNWTEIIVSVCTLVFTGILIPIAKSLINKVKVEIETTLNEQDEKLVCGDFRQMGAAMAAK